MRILVAAAVSLHLASCVRTPNISESLDVGGTTVGSGGDPNEQLFQSARFADIAIMKRTVPSEVASDLSSESDKVWAIQNWTAIQDDLRQTPQVWDSPNAPINGDCSASVDTPRAPIFFARHACAQQYSTAFDGTQLVLQISIRHLGMQDPQALWLAGDILTRWFDHHQTDAGGVAAPNEKETFDKARKHAALAVQADTGGLTDLVAPDLAKWWTSHSSAALQDINTVEYKWDTQRPTGFPQDTCAATSPTLNAPIYFETSICEKEAAALFLASQLVIHETIHHLGKTDEVEVETLATAVYINSAIDLDTGVFGSGE